MKVQIEHPGGSRTSEAPYTFNNKNDPQGWQCGCSSRCHPWERRLDTMLSAGVESGTAQRDWGLLVKRPLIPFSFPCLH